MPLYRVRGVGIKSGRRRTRNWFAYKEDGLYERAAKEETKIVEIEEIFRAPDHDQLFEAEKLGIKVLPTHNYDDLFYLVHCEKSLLASQNQLDAMRSVGASLGTKQPPTELQVVREIDSHLGENAVYERARWYVYSVARYLTRGVWLSPRESGIPSAVIDEVVLELTQDQWCRRKLQESAGHPAYDLSRHGCDELNTKLFKRTRDLLTEKLRLSHAAGANIGNAAPDIRGEAQKNLEQKLIRAGLLTYAEPTLYHFHVSFGPSTKVEEIMQPGSHWKIALGLTLGLAVLLLVWVLLLQ